MFPVYCYLQQRHALLEDAICLYGFYRECDDFEKWIKDKERMLRADDSTDNVETAKRKYEVSSDCTFFAHFSRSPNYCTLKNTDLHGVSMYTKKQRKLICLFNDTFEQHT